MIITMSNNYPDDIRNYDDDPRSPFYEDGPECQECGECMAVETDADESGYYTVTNCINVDCPECESFEGDESE
jgi:hypothetical protein